MTQETIHVEPQTDACPECGAAALVKDQEAGEVICSACGLVVDAVVDRGPDWRVFEAGDMHSKPRAAPTLIPALDTGPRTLLTRGFSSDPETWAAMRRLRRLQARETSSRARNFNDARKDLFRLGDRAHVPWSILEQAAAIYRRAYGHGLIRGRSIQIIVAGSIYVACRLQGSTRSGKELAEAMGIDPRELARVYRLIVEELQLSPSRIQAEEHVPRLAEALGLTWGETRAAIELLREARRRRHTAGKDPRGLAAGAVYLAARDRPPKNKITQEALAEASGVTEVTIRNRYKGLQEAVPYTQA